ncbi:MAG: hypothetical protein WBD22_07750 [Pyrinomonadaceae bacterium]
MLRINLVLALIILLASSIQVSAQNRTGTYQWKFKDTAIGIIKIKETKAGKRRRIKFEIHIGQSDYPCVGEMTGSLKFVSSNLYEYNPDRPSRGRADELNYCRLSFVFSGNNVVVRENACEDFHGARCNFEGKYTRVKR